MAQLGSGTVESFRADLSNLVEVDGLADAIGKQYSHIDVLINNAGVYKTAKPITNDNLDVRFVVNTLAPYLLTKRLLPLMDDSGRVINLSSAAQAAVDLDVMAGKKPVNEDFDAYAQSKLAITMWSRQLALELGDKAPAIIAVNPGSLLASKMVKEGFGVAGKDINIGADILIRASFDESFAQASGLYFDNYIGDFSPPHADTLKGSQCEALILVMEKILERILQR